MKTLRNLFLSVSAVALIGASGLFAQTTQATATIPFAFSASDSMLPAGEYAIVEAPATHAMYIRNVETRGMIVVLTRNTTEYKQAPDKNVLLFHRVGDKYFLAEVNTAAVKGHLGESKLERELTKGEGQPMAAVIIPALNVR